MSTHETKAKTFTHEGKTYRLIGRQVREWERGYSEPDIVRYNVLQVRNAFRMWRDVETEVIPEYVLIDIACLGAYIGDWKSALHQKCYEMGMQRNDRAVAEKSEDDPGAEQAEEANVAQERG